MEAEPDRPNRRPTRDHRPAVCEALVVLWNFRRSLTLRVSQPHVACLRERGLVMSSLFCLFLGLLAGGAAGFIACAMLTVGQQSETSEKGGFDQRRAI